MRHPSLLTVFTAVIAGSTVAIAQPPDNRDGIRGDAIRAALDTNGDRQLDAEEIKNAAASLATADRNGDGRIDHEEFRPPLPPIPRGEGGFRGPPRDASVEPGPPRNERPFRGEGRPRPEGGPSPERFVERAMAFDADGDGKLDRAEMEKFAGEMMQRLRPAMAERGAGPAGERGRGLRDGEGPRRRPEGSDSGERPERPRRPE